MQPTPCGRRAISLYNAYIPGEAPYEKCEETPPPKEKTPPTGQSGQSGQSHDPSDGVLRRLLRQLGLSGTEKAPTLLEGLGLGKLDSGDLLLLALLFLLLREGKTPRKTEGTSAEAEKKPGSSSDFVLLLALAAAFLLGDDGL